MLIEKKDKQIENEYLNTGFVVQDISDKKSLDWIRNFYFKIIKKTLPTINETTPNDILNNIHNYLHVSKLNKFRLKLINEINENQTFRKNFYKISKPLLDIVAGNELAMQKKISLSIQFPKDDSSLLPVHADTWTGVSPFETVIWLPLVDCYKTKSMFILPSGKSNKLNKIFSKKNIKNSKDIYNKIKKDLIWLKVKYGQIVIFDHSLPHGNIINKEDETRWSMNCRFKGLFTPYKDKRIGEYYEPITIKPATRRGINYKFPK
jgi:sporadic carbohydrate cluster 2OG-Fe(II) oxygenase